MSEQTRTPQQEAVAAELKRFGADLNLTDAQKAQAKTAFEAASAKVAEFQKSGKTLSKEEVAAMHTTLRTKLVAFLTPEQLTKWDAEMAKAKTFLGQHV